MRRITMLLALVLLLAGCTVTVSTGGGAPVVDDAGWTRSPNYTTCDQWTGEMTVQQRLAMAKLILPTLRRTVDTAAGDGLDQAPAFVEAITEACASDVIRSQSSTYVITAAATFAFVMASSAPYRP